jgi:hypothetical protein
MPVKEVSAVIEGQEFSRRKIMFSFKHKESKPPRVVVEVNDSS